MDASGDEKDSVAVPDGPVPDLPDLRAGDPQDHEAIGLTPLPAAPYRVDA